MAFRCPSAIAFLDRTHFLLLLCRGKDSPAVITLHLGWISCIAFGGFRIALHRVLCLTGTISRNIGIEHATGTLTLAQTSSVYLQLARLTRGEYPHYSFVCPDKTQNSIPVTMIRSTSTVSTRIYRQMIASTGSPQAVKNNQARNFVFAEEEENH